MAKIICISDLHYSQNSDPRVYDPAQISAKLKESLSEKVYDPLFNALESEEEPSDLLIFCGDYVKGYQSEGEKEIALNSFVKFLERIEKSRKIVKGRKKNERIIIVPGNHDITRGTTIYSKFENALKRYLTPFSNKLDYPDAPTFVFKGLGLMVDCEATTDNSATINEKIQNWIDKINASQAADEEKEALVNDLEKERIIDIPSVSADDSTRFKSTAKRISSDKKYNNYLKIMVTHHPLLSGIESGTTIKNFNSTIGGFSFMRAAMEYGYTLFIHGHIHERTCIEMTDYGHDEPYTSVQVGVPNFELDKPDNGIIVIDTGKSDENNWPFTIIYKSFSGLTYTFKQSRVLNGEKKNKREEKRENENMVLLVDTDIVKLIDEGKVIKNGDRQRVEAASYDCVLGYQYKKSSSRNCDWGAIAESKLEPSNGVAATITIAPQETVLIYTYEEFDVPKNMVMHASPISTWLRKGLQVDISYFVDPGFKGQFCFPVVNVSDKPISISSRESIMSIELIMLAKTCEKGWSERHPDIATARKMRKY